MEFVASCGLHSVPYVQHKTVFADITSKHYIGIQTRQLNTYTLLNGRSLCLQCVHKNIKATTFYHDFR